MFYLCYTYIHSLVLNIDYFKLYNNILKLYNIKLLNSFYPYVTHKSN